MKYSWLKKEWSPTILLTFLPALQLKNTVYGYLAPLLFCISNFRKQAILRDCLRGRFPQHVVVSTYDWGLLKCGYGKSKGESSQMILREHLSMMSLWLVICFAFVFWAMFQGIRFGLITRFIRPLSIIFRLPTRDRLGLFTIQNYSIFFQCCDTIKVFINS